MLKYILPFIFLLFMTSPGQASGHIYTDTIQGKQQEEIYHQFRSLFPDLFESDITADRKKIPAWLIEAIGHPHDPDFEIWHAIGKIENYRGLDIFLCSYDFFREDEDTYDNHIDGIEYLLIFRDSKLQTPQENSSENPGKIIAHYYHGEGGYYDHNSRFDADSTLISYLFLSESESASGYQTPLETKTEFRHRINDKGAFDLLEVMTVEFSSPFYLKDFVDKHTEIWMKSEFRNYPTEDMKWQLSASTIPSLPRLVLPHEELELYFYIKATDNAFQIIFECYNNSELIDQYVVGDETSKQLYARFRVEGKSVQECPVIIKTSDGEIELLSNGKFILH